MMFQVLFQVNKRPDFESMKAKGKRINNENQSTVKYIKYKKQERDQLYYMGIMPAKEVNNNMVLVVSINHCSYWTLRPNLSLFMLKLFILNNTYQNVNNNRFQYICTSLFLTSTLFAFTVLLVRSPVGAPGFWAAFYLNEAFHQPP